MRRQPRWIAAAAELSMELNMQYQTRRALTLFAAAGLLVGIGANPAHAQVATDAGLLQGDVSASLDQAADLLAQGSVVKARAILVELGSGARLVSMTGAQQSRLSAMLGNATRRMNAMNAMEVSLQTAALSLETGELALATRHAQAVIDSPKATNEQSQMARTVLAKAQAAREAIAPRVETLIGSARTQLENGNFSHARETLTTLRRSGVTLTPAQEQLVAAAQMQVVEAQTASAGMMQPGVIKRREEKPAPAKPADQPAEAPKAEQPAKPVEAPKAQEAPKPAAPAKPVEAPKAEQPAKPVEAPKAQEAPKPAAPAKPVEAPKAQEAPKPQPPAADPIERAKEWEAQSLLADADQAFEQNRLNDALSKYDRLLRLFGAQLTPEQTTRATERRAEAQVRLGGGPGDVLETQIRADEIRRQQINAEFNNDLEQATKALAGGDVETARNLTATANLRISQNQRLFSQPQVDGYRTKVSDLFSRIEGESERIRVNELRTKEQQAEVARSDAARAASENRARQISEAISRVRALQQEQKYEEALQVVDNILFLDPINPTGLLLKTVIDDIIIYRRYLRIQDTKYKNISLQSVDNAEATIAPPNIIDYPADWPKISYQRGTNEAFTDSAENRRVLSVLDSRRIPVSFNDVPLGNVVDFIRGVTQLNVDVDWASLEEVSISRDDTVTLNLTNVSLRTALDRALERVSKDTEAAAAWAVQDGVLTIASKSVIARNKALVIYDIRDLLITVPDYIDAPEFDLQAVLQGAQQGGGGGGQSPFQTEQNQERDLRTIEERTQDIITLITTNVDQPGWQENGGSVGFIQQFQGNLIITNTPANHREIEGLLSKLRQVRAMQINVENRFLLVSQDFFEQVGFDLDIYWNGDNNQVRAARAANPGGNIQPSDFFDFSRGGIQRNVRGANNTTNPTPLPSPLSVVGSAQNSISLTESLTPGEFAGGILQRAPALGIGGQFLDDIQVDFLIKATQADRRTVNLTAPRLTFTNGQWAHIAVATQVAFISDLQPVVSESAVGFDPDVAVVNEGVVLLTQGTITADRRYVTLNVEADVARIDGFANSPVTAIAGGQLVNSAATQSFIQLPTVTTTIVRTTVTVPDQGTVLLGGQRVVSESEVETGVPVLSKIPIINRFFTNRTTTREEQTLLILIKPTILIQNEQEERAHPGVSESIKSPFGG
ncbi:MAG: hypothetical protein IPM33_02405 [Phycisphaerales bacterium]|nr:hypothetical protein [Phycisphaerales bacterium]